MVGGATHAGFLDTSRRIRHGLCSSFMWEKTWQRSSGFSHPTAQTGKFSNMWVALWWLCEAENNIYKASHLTSFITKSHTPASPLKLGVNPSSASLCFLPLYPGLHLQSTHLHSAKDRRENFGVIQKQCDSLQSQSHPKKLIKTQKGWRLQTGSRGAASVLLRVLSWRGWTSPEATEMPHYLPCHRHSFFDYNNEPL